MLNNGYKDLGNNKIDLYPPELREEINAFHEPTYRKLNNGVYRAGLATTQQTQEDAVWGVFDMLDGLERRLGDGRAILFGDRLTETDIRLFVTLVRFDAAYPGLFNCNLHRLIDYSWLTTYLQRMLSVASIKEAVKIDHIKRGYYSIKALNPSLVVPVGPDNCPSQSEVYGD